MLIKKCLGILFCALLINSLAFSQSNSYEKHLFIKHSDTLPYRVLLPENYDASQSYPLIIFLHGSGERGNDNEAQLKHGGSLFLVDSIRKKYPAIVVFPQCPENSFWSNVNIKSDTSAHTKTFNFKTGSKPTLAMKLLLGLLKNLEATYKIRESQRYVGGLSMGGMGTFELAKRKSGYFAAAISICGGANPAIARKLNKTNWWIFHGAKDNVVPVHFSEDMADALKKENANVRITIYPQADHNSWDSAFAEKDLMQWLFTSIK